MLIVEVLIYIQLLIAGPMPLGSSHQLPSAAVPSELDGVGITEKLGTSLVELKTQFVRQDGKVFKFPELLQGRPLIISPIYYACPGLCNFHLNGLIDGLKTMDWNPGQQFDLVVVSFDSKEGPDLADKKRNTYLKVYNRPSAIDGMNFYTSDEAGIKELTQAIGFTMKWNSDINEWAHASAAIVVTPEGKISRYLPGVFFENKTLKLAITEAGRGVVGSIMDRAALFCFKYDPKAGKYVLASFRLMQFGGGLIVLGLFVWLFPVWLRSRRQFLMAKG